MPHQRHQPYPRHIGQLRLAWKSARLCHTGEDERARTVAIHSRACSLAQGEPDKTMKVDQPGGIEHRLCENALGAAGDRLARQHETIAIDLAAEIRIAEDQGNDRSCKLRGTPATEQPASKILSSFNRLQGCAE